MARNNRLIEMVFANVVGTEDRVSLYDKFNGTDSALKIEETKDLKARRVDSPTALSSASARGI
jgi:hypothetical protein